jgi:hypothetical protein
VELVTPMSIPTLPESGLLVTPFEIAHLLSEADAVASSLARFLQLDEVAQDPAYVGLGAASIAARARSLDDPGEREVFEALFVHARRVVGGLVTSASLLIDDIDSRRRLIVGTDGVDAILFELQTEGWLSLVATSARDARAIRAAALDARHGFVLVSVSGDGSESGCAWDGGEHLASLAGPGRWITAPAGPGTVGPVLDIELARLLPSLDGER